MRVVITPLARADIREITGYISSQGAPRAAARLGREIAAACASLRTLPERFEEAPGYGRDLRRKVVGNYLIFYRVGKMTVDIIEVRDGRRAPGKLDR